jgi:hypothetical protein
MDRREDLVVEFGGKSLSQRHVQRSDGGAPPVSASQGPVAALANACKAAVIGWIVSVWSRTSWRSAR